METNTISTGPITFDVRYDSNERKTKESMEKLDAIISYISDFDEGRRPGTLSLVKGAVYKATNLGSVKDQVYARADWLIFDTKRAVKKTGIDLEALAEQKYRNGAFLDVSERKIQNAYDFMKKKTKDAATYFSDINVEGINSLKASYKNNSYDTLKPERITLNGEEFSIKELDEKEDEEIEKRLKLFGDNLNVVLNDVTGDVNIAIDSIYTRFTSLKDKISAIYQSEVTQFDKTENQ